MRIAVLSDCRVPTLPVGGHGLGRAACDLATGLRAKGHAVTLYAGVGSIAPADVALVTHDDEITRVGALDPSDADVWLDLSHYHALTRRRAFKQAHFIVDDECGHEPVNTIVGSAFRQRSWPVSQIVPLGIDVDAIPFNAKGGSHLLFAAKMHANKGPDIAEAVAKKAGRALHAYGELYPPYTTLDGYRGTIADNAEFYRVLGASHAFLAPYRNDAGGRVLLEAQATGTPVLTFGDVGCISHVAHCVSGFVCATPDEMADAVADVAYLRRETVREWVSAHHSMRVMIEGMERLLERAADGEVW
jgi:glycosyltransferase involved in cell wall biosynthesis